MKLSGIGVLSALFGIGIVFLGFVVFEGSILVLAVGGAFFLLGLLAKEQEPQKTCRFCRSSIHAAASVCPKCQREQGAPAARSAARAR